MVLQVSTEIPVSEREESVIVNDKDTDMPVVEAEHAVNVNDEDTSDIESNVTGNIQQAVSHGKYHCRTCPPPIVKNRDAFSLISFKD